MRYATVRDLSRNPSKVISGKEPVVITRNGKPARILIPFDEDMLFLNEPVVRNSIKKSLRAKTQGNKGKSVKQLIASTRKRKK